MSVSAGSDTGVRLGEAQEGERVGYGGEKVAKPPLACLRRLHAPIVAMLARGVLAAVVIAPGLRNNCK